MQKSDLKNKIILFARNYQLMAIATTGKSHPWIATVYYAVDEDLTFYIVTDPQSLHGTHIAQNSHVSCAIYDSTQTPHFQKDFVKAGIQFWGDARIVRDDADVERGLALWKSALGIHGDEKYSVKGMKSGVIRSKLYQVKPKKIKFFHETLAKNEDGMIFEF